MSTNRALGEPDILEKWRTSLENVNNQPVVAQEMAEIGYPKEVIDVGRGLYGVARSAFDANKKEGGEASAASSTFQKEEATLVKGYSQHRKKAKFVFRNDPIALRVLDVHQPVSDSYIPRIESVKKFYTVLSTDKTLSDAMETIKVPASEISEGLAQVAIVEKARADYIREQGEAMDAVAQKDAAFKEAEKWMRDFYAAARIALEDRPMLYATLFK